MPLLAESVEVCWGLEMLSERVGDGVRRGDAASGSRVGDTRPVTAFDRAIVFDCGLKSTGGLSARSVVEEESRLSDEAFAGPVFEGDIDRALSEETFR